MSRVGKEQAEEWRVQSTFWSCPNHFCDLSTFLGSSLLPYKKEIMYNTNMMKERARSRKNRFIKTEWMKMARLRERYSTRVDYEERKKLQELKENKTCFYSNIICKQEWSE